MTNVQEKLATGQRATIADLEAMAHRHALTCQDVVVPTGAIRYIGGGRISWDAPDLLNPKGNADLETLAYRQFINRLQGLSVRWLWNEDRCPPDLEVDVVKRLLRHRTRADHKRLLLRLRNGEGGDTVRAVLSDEYTPFDNETFVEMVYDAMQSVSGDMHVVRASVGDYLRTYILIEGIEYNTDAPSGEGLHPGIYITNSEVGTGSARVCAGLWRDYCTNGLVYGWRDKDNEVLIHRHYTKTAFKTVVADNIARAFQMSIEAAEKFVASYSVPVDGHRLEELIDQWSKSGVTVQSQENWAVMTHQYATSEGRDPWGNLKLYDVVNGLTEAAQMTTNEDEQERMEVLAGDLLANMS